MKRAKHAFVELYIGKLLPIGSGLYSKSFCKSEHKQTQKCYFEQGDYYYKKNISKY